jgi:predicted amidohydrolase
MKSYTAVVIQTSVKEVYSREDVVENFARVCRIIHTSAPFHYYGTRVENKLFVFDTHAHNHHYSQPDMCSKVAIELPGPELRAVQDTARELGIHIATSALEFDPNFPLTYFTCLFIVGPEGDIVYKYRKVHTHVGTEKTLSPYDAMDRYRELYGQGKSLLETLFPVADTPLGRIGMLIAHDRNYPEACRAMAMNGAEILILGPQPEPSVANGRWEAINRVRAFENMAYVIAPNYGEFISDERVRQRWGGHSMIVDFEGKIVADAPYTGEALCAGLIELEALRERRADPYDSPLAELRADVYREIYAKTVYPPNRYANMPPPDAAKDRLDFFEPVYRELVARGAYVEPESPG